jgi:hypothetical protein
MLPRIKSFMNKEHLTASQDVTPRFLITVFKTTCLPPELPRVRWDQFTSSHSTQFYTPIYHYIFQAVLFLQISPQKVLQHDFENSPPPPLKNLILFVRIALTVPLCLRRFDSPWVLFRLLNPSGRTLSLASTQYLGHSLVVKAAFAINDNLTTILCRFSENPGNLNLLKPSGSILACTGISLPLHFTVTFKYTRVGASPIIEQIIFLWRRNFYAVSCKLVRIECRENILQSSAKCLHSDSTHLCSILFTLNSKQFAPSSIRPAKMKGKERNIK